MVLYFEQQKHDWMNRTDISLYLQDDSQDKGSKDMLNLLLRILDINSVIMFT